MRKFLRQFIATLFVLGVFLHATPVFAAVDIDKAKVQAVIDGQNDGSNLTKDEREFYKTEIKKLALFGKLATDQAGVAQANGLHSSEIPAAIRLSDVQIERVTKAVNGHVASGNSANFFTAEELSAGNLGTPEEVEAANKLLRIVQGSKAATTADLKVTARPDPGGMGSCSFTFGRYTPCIRDALIWILTVIVIPALGILLSFAASVLDLSVRISVIDFAEYANLPVFKEIWALGRDLVNIFFIFILLYSAFDTMLQVGKQKFQDTLGTIVLVAVLINFSFPIARVMIDVSNVFANEFYHAINPDGTKLSQVIIKNLSFFSQTSLNNAVDFTRLSTGSEGGVKTVGDNADLTSTIVSFFGVIIVMITLGINLLLAAYFFLQRTVTLLILITFSAMAFAAQLVPKMKDVYKYYGQWWGMLINELTYAPAYLLLLYFALRVSGAAGQIIDITNKSSAGSLISIQGIGAAIYFVILVGLLNAAISLAKDSGAAGAGAAKGWADSTQAWLLNKPKQLGYATAGLAGRAGLAAGKAVTVTPANYVARRTIVPLADSLSKNATVKALAQNTAIGKSFQERLEKTSKEGFGQKALTEDSKAFLERFKDADAVDKARVIGNTNAITGLDETTAKQTFKGLSEQDKAAIMYEAETNQALDEATKKRITMLYGESTKKPEDKAKLDRAKTEVEVKAKVKKLIEKLGKENPDEKKLADDDKKIIKKIPKNLLLAYAEVLIDDKNRDQIFQNLTAAQISQLIGEADIGDKREALKNMLESGQSTNQEMQVALGNARVRENLGLPPAAKGNRKKKGSPQGGNPGPGPRPQSDEERDFGSAKDWNQSLG